MEVASTQEQNLALGLNIPVPSKQTNKQKKQWDWKQTILKLSSILRHSMILLPFASKKTLPIKKCTPSAITVHKSTLSRLYPSLLEKQQNEVQFLLNYACCQFCTDDYNTTANRSAGQSPWCQLKFHALHQLTFYPTYYTLHIKPDGFFFFILCLAFNISLHFHQLHQASNSSNNCCWMNCCRWMPKELVFFLPSFLSSALPIFLSSFLHFLLSFLPFFFKRVNVLCQLVRRKVSHLVLPIVRAVSPALSVGAALRKVLTIIWATFHWFTEKWECSPKCLWTYAHPAEAAQKLWSPSSKCSSLWTEWRFYVKNKVNCL